MNQYPFSQACENNKAAILEVLSVAFAHCQSVLEIASGTGQHATWFAQHLGHLRWQASELSENLASLKPRVQAYTGDNLFPPIALNVSQRPWLHPPLVDAVFTANSLHIMPWTAVNALFSELGERAAIGTVLAIYGPFNYKGRYTSQSNARFDLWLKRQSPQSAIRDFERVDELALGAGFVLQEDYTMPANNRLLVWKRGPL